MSEPSPPTHDPITAILIAVTEIKGQIRSTLDRLERHQHQLDAHSITLIEHGERITTLEAHNATNGENDRRLTGNRAVLWAAAGVAVMALSLLISIFLMLKH